MPACISTAVAGKALLRPSAAGVQLSLCILHETSSPRGKTGEGVPGGGGTQGTGSDGFRASSLAALCLQPVAWS